MSNDNLKQEIRIVNLDAGLHLDEGEDLEAEWMKGHAS